ncbi:MAG: hypothetical protein ABIQ95_11980 [Bdellovibrionia bacterium]
MKILPLILISLFFNNIALAVEGIKATCTESSKKGNRKGAYPLPAAFLQAGDSLSFGSYIHISDRYMITIVPPISDAIQNVPSSRGIDDPGTYEVLLTRLPAHEKHPALPEKLCHGASVLISGAEAKTIELKFHKKDDVGGFLPFTTQFSCELNIVNI